MRERVATMVFSILLSLLAGGGAASADEAKFHFINATPETVYVNLFPRV